MAEDNGSSGARTDPVALATLSMLVALREDAATAPAERRKSEVILSEVGMSLGDIALVTGKHYESVKTTIRRAREKGVVAPRARRGALSDASGGTR